MARTIKWTGGAPPTRTIAAAALLGASAVLVRLAARLDATRTAAERRTLEFAELSVGGQRGGALYEDGRFVGWLPGVPRL
jgi:hypothetical protein